MLFPDLNYNEGTQKDIVYKMLQSGEKSGRDFLKEFIPEYRSRVNEIDKDLREHGYFIRHRWDKDADEKFIFFEIREYNLFEVAV